MEEIKSRFEQAAQALNIRTLLPLRTSLLRRFFIKLWTLPSQVLSWLITQWLKPQIVSITTIRDCRVALLKGPSGQGLSVGQTLFIWFDDQSGPPSEARIQRLITHEYGHWAQAIRLGPLWPLVIGLPSLLWASLPIFRNLRQRKGISYYSFYPERWADHLGGQILNLPLGRR